MKTEEVAGKEFPEGSKIFFLGEHVNGVAATVAATTETETSLSVMLAVRLLVILYHSALLNSSLFSSSQPKRLRMTSSKPTFCCC